MKQRITLTLALIGLAGSANASSTWYVDINGTAPGSGTLADPYTSIQYAIDQPTTVNEDEILVLPGSYFETLDLTGRTLAIRSTAGSATTILDAAGSGPAVLVANGAIDIEGLTIRFGAGGNGGGLRAIDSDVLLLDCLVAGNSGALGGGAYTMRGSLTLEGCEFTGNVAASGAGLYAEETELSAVNTEFTQNFASTGRGGGVYFNGAGLFACTLTGCDVNQNTASFDGGGLWCVQGDPVTLSGCTVRENDCGLQGGGANLQGVMVNVSGTIFEDNRADQGAGLYIGDAEEFISISAGCLFRENVASAEGGGAYVIAHDGGSITGSLFSWRS